MLRIAVTFAPMCVMGMKPLSSAPDVILRALKIPQKDGVLVLDNADETDLKAGDRVKISGVEKTDQFCRFNTRGNEWMDIDYNGIEVFFSQFTTDETVCECIYKLKGVFVQGLGDKNDTWMQHKVTVPVNCIYPVSFPREETAEDVAAREARKLNARQLKEADFIHAIKVKYYWTVPGKHILASPGKDPEKDKTIFRLLWTAVPNGSTPASWQQFLEEEVEGDQMEGLALDKYYVIEAKYKQYLNAYKVHLYGPLPAYSGIAGCSLCNGTGSTKPPMLRKYVACDLCARTWKALTKPTRKQHAAFDKLNPLLKESRR